MHRGAGEGPGQISSHVPHTGRGSEFVQAGKPHLVQQLPRETAHCQSPRSACLLHRPSRAHHCCLFQGLGGGLALHSLQERSVALPGQRRLTWLLLGLPSVTALPAQGRGIWVRGRTTGWAWGPTARRTSAKAPRAPARTGDHSGVAGLLDQGQMRAGVQQHLNICIASRSPVRGHSGRTPWWVPLRELPGSVPDFSLRRLHHPIVKGFWAAVWELSGGC